jgi:hypothetical protein
MSTGTAIFLSIVLVTAAWQIGRRNAWVKVGKVVAVILGLCVLCWTLNLGWEEIERRKEEKWAVENTLSLKKEIQASGATELDGISVGMNDRDVLYSLGKPDKVEQEDEVQVKNWIYEPKSAGHHRNVAFYAGRVIRITIQQTEDYVTFSTHGISLGDIESSVIDKLGEPSEPPNIDENGVKRLKYGPKNRRLKFFLRQGKVLGVQVGDGTTAIEKGKEALY